MPVIAHVHLLAAYPVLGIGMVLAEQIFMNHLTCENMMSWFGKGAERRVFQMILASVMVLGTSASVWSQGFEDDFAQEWVDLEDDARAIELAGCFSPHAASCDGCDAGCESCSKSCFCPPWWAHRSGLMAQYLLLRPGNSDVVYTIEQNNLPPNEFPTGPMGIAAIEHSSGVRAGFSCCATECTSLVGSVTYWQGEDSSVIDATGGNILASEILHPSRLSTGASGLQEAANYDMKFGLADLAYRHIWKKSDCYAINWRGGFQYGAMDQSFQWAQTIPSSVAVGTFAVDTDIDFDGFGLLGGLDFERYSCKSGLSCYGKATGSALAGKWKASYRDIPQLAGGSVGNRYDDFRVTPVLELELGLGWTSKCGRVRANVGYMTSAWYNSLSTRSYIDAVRAARFIDVSETITFSGLVVGGEYRF